MVLKPLKVNWNTSALAKLHEICNYIRQDSPQNAVMVRKELLTITRSLAAQPEKFPLDKYKTGNDGTYRAFEKYRYRVIYRVLKTEVKIINIRHTSMNPVEY